MLCCVTVCFFLVPLFVFFQCYYLLFPVDIKTIGTRPAKGVGIVSFSMGSKECADLGMRACLYIGEKE